MTEPGARALLIDISRMIWRAWAGKRATGIDRVTIAYVDHYGERAQAVIQKGEFRRILSPEISAHLFILLRDRPRNFKWQLANFLIKDLLSFGRWQSGDGRIYLNVGHTGLNANGLWAWVKRLNLRPVFLVHDLIPLTHYEYSRTDEFEKHRRRMTNMITIGHGIIANSHQSLDDLAQFSRSMSKRLPPNCVAHLAGHKAATLDRNFSPIAEPYFVMLGTIEGRKNHLMILNIWRTMATTLRKETPKLVLIGQRGWESEQVVDMLERCAAIKDYVVELIDCSDNDAKNYLSHARALLFPSFAEGFGMPLIEALALGTPVIASNLDVFKEVAGDIPEYLSPLDGLGWMAVIADYTSTTSARRAAQVERLRNYAAPTWEQHFAQVDRWLATVT